LREREPQSWLQDVVDALRSLEDQLLAAHKQQLIQSIVLRYGLFYGSETPSTAFMVKMLKRRFLPTAGGARGFASFIHIRDAVSASVAATERNVDGGIYNVADDEPVGMNEWIKQAALSVGAKRPFSIPLPLLRLVMPYMAVVFDTRLAVGNEKAKRDLDLRLEYPTYREGLREVAANVGK
jgi:nucleoside-diphosphate-sugar epimerase